jgi:NADPH:quinone reductase-like Zn-dependent oxidoreductase
VDAAANAAPGGAATAIRAVADGGRLVTITSDPPGEQRGVKVASIYVRPDGNQLRKLAKQFADGQLHVRIASRDRLADAAQATGGHAGGAIVLSL